MRRLVGIAALAVVCGVLLARSTPAFDLLAPLSFDGSVAAHVPDEGRALADRGGIESTIHSAETSVLLRARAAADAITVAAGSDRPWKELGPKPYVSDDPNYPNTASEGFGVVGGRMTSLAVDPTDPAIVYAGAAGGGVWKTTNGGSTWKPIGDQLPSMAVGAIAIDPANRHHVLVGTGESNTGGDNLYGTGVYDSHDGGATFQRPSANIADGSTVAHIEIGGGRIFVATSQGLFRSTDGGASYQNVSLPTNAAGTSPDRFFLSNIVSDVRIKPGATNEVTAVVGWRKGVKSGSTRGALYRSTSGGAPGSFKRLSPAGFGTPDPNLQSTDPIGRVSLAYAAGAGQDHNILWAVIEDAGVEAGDTFVGTSLPPKYTSLNGVYRSGDDGATWTLKATSLVLAAAPISSLDYRLPLDYGPGIQAWYDQWISVDPTNPDRVLLGLEEIYQTVAGANTPVGPAVWKTIGRYNNLCVLSTSCDPTQPGPVLGGLTTHPDQHAAAFALLPGGGVRLFVGNDGGVWKQDAAPLTGYDNDHWTSVNSTLGTTQPYDAVMSADGTVYAGLQDNGTAKIFPNGKAVSAEGGDGFDVAVDPKKSSVAFTELPYGAVEVTTDGGASWTSIQPSSNSAQFDAPIKMDPRNANHVVIAAREIWETTAGAATTASSWKMSYDLGRNTAGAFDNSISAVDVLGSEIYAGFCGLCDVVTDGRGDVSRFHNGIATNVQAGCKSAVGAGTCWHKAAAIGLPNRLITGLAIDPSDHRTVFATLGGYARRGFPPLRGTAGIGTGHLYVSHDAGQHFTDMSSNLPDSVANSVTIRGNQLIVGTDVGVFIGSRDGGFSRLGTGFPNAPAWRTSLNPSGNILVVATHGRGVWAYDFGQAAGATAPQPPAAVATPPRRALPATGRDVTPWAALMLVAALAARASVRRS